MRKMFFGIAATILVAGTVAYSGYTAFSNNNDPGERVCCVCDDGTIGCEDASGSCTESDCMPECNVE
jgi:hypothetical protein